MKGFPKLKLKLTAEIVESVTASIIPFGHSLLFKTKYLFFNFSELPCWKEMELMKNIATIMWNQQRRWKVNLMPALFFLLMLNISHLVMSHPAQNLLVLVNIKISIEPLRHQNQACQNPKITTHTQIATLIVTQKQTNMAQLHHQWVKRETKPTERRFKSRKH